MGAKVMRTRSGERFLIVEYSGEKCDWEDAILEARRRFGSTIDRLPVIAVRRGSCFGCRIIDPPPAEKTQLELFEETEAAR